MENVEIETKRATETHTHFSNPDPHEYDLFERGKPFEYTVVPVGGEGGPGYGASTPYRQITYIGATPEAAIGCMLRGVAELARQGSLNPACPQKRGVPPIQHVLSLLSEELDRTVDTRRQQINDLPQSIPHVWPENATSAQLARTNEKISGLATALAALARVKEL